MKKLLIIFVFIAQVSFGQITAVRSSGITTLEHEPNSRGYIIAAHEGIEPLRSVGIELLVVDSILINRCKKRGHFPDGGLMFSTSMYCPDYVIDTDSTSILVHPACNSISYKCGRCHPQVNKNDKETREIIWKK